MASLKSVGESCQIPIKYYSNNIIGSINLIEVRHYPFDKVNMFLYFCLLLLFKGYG